MNLNKTMIERVGKEGGGEGGGGGGGVAEDKESDEVF